MRDPSEYRDKSHEMFGEALVTVTRDEGPGDSYGHDVPDDEAPAGHSLDRPEAMMLHARLAGHYARELQRQHENRVQMQIDEAFYDHDHWTPEERTILEGRGQVAITYNVTQTAVNWVLGSQRRQPLDYTILPRRKDGARHAEIKSEIMKYLSDVNNGPDVSSSAFGESTKAGLSWLECGVQDEDSGEPIYERFETWRNVLHDSSSKEKDFSDARYIFRVRWTDVDRAAAMFPDRKDVIEGSAETVFGTGATVTGSGDWAMDEQEAAAETVGAIWAGGHNGSTERSRVRLIECWYRTPQPVDVMAGGEFSGEMHDPRSEGHAASLESGQASIRRRIRERVMVALLCDRGLLWNGPSPYRHNRFPFTPVWGFRRASDNLPYGMIRGIRDIQRDVNKRASKSLYHLSAQRVMYQEGAVEDVEQLREESQRPDAVIAYKAGYPAPSIIPGTQMAAAHNELMSMGINMIQQTSGVTDENMGRSTNATSGRAILARQEQGQMTTNALFENLAYARKIHGEKLLSLVEQFMDEERQFRITGKTGGAQYIGINDDSEDDNHITRTKADFIVAERDYRVTQRQAAMEMLMENLARLAPALPGLAPAIIDLIVDASDIPNREEIVKRIRAVTGQRDPDAEDNPNDPEVMAKAQAEQMQQQMMMRQAVAEISAVEAQAAERQARAAKASADAGLSASRANDVQSEAEEREIAKLAAAVKVALDMAAQPGTGAAADVILQTAEGRAAMSQAMQQPGAMPPDNALPTGPQDAADLSAQDALQPPMQTAPV